MSSRTPRSTGPPPGAGEAGERSRLAAGMQSLGLEPAEESLGRLMAYAGLVRKWSRTYNLVARGDLDDLVGRHILDSLAVHAHVRSPNLLDVGSGAGFPGVPLAIARPGLDVRLLDSAGKKVRFLNHAIRSLGLRNARAVHARAEAYRAPEPVSTVTARAFGSLADIARGVRHLATRETRILAMKGRRPDSELEALPEWAEVLSVERIEVPDLHVERHLVIMCLSPEPD